MQDHETELVRKLAFQVETLNKKVASLTTAIETLTHRLPAKESPDPSSGGKSA
jgi:chaperonin cofactor prefoldin